MSRCRVASRVALRGEGRIACVQPVLATILATKVSPFQLPLFSPSGGGRSGRARHPRLSSADIGAGGGGLVAWLAARPCVGGDGRRVVSSSALPPTLLIITILVTNGDFLGDAS